MMLLHPVHTLPLTPANLPLLSALSLGLPHFQHLLRRLLLILGLPLLASHGSTSCRFIESVSIVVISNTFCLYEAPSLSALLVTSQLTVGSLRKINESRSTCCFLRRGLTVNRRPFALGEFL